MSRIDPEVLYLILTKVASQESCYTYDPKELAPGQRSGTVTPKKLAEVYERITSHRVGSQLNWNAPLAQLDELLARCGLPALSGVVREANGVDEKPWSAPPSKWPAFSALKELYRKRGK